MSHFDSIPRICPANSTTTPLGGGESFTGPWIDLQHLTTVTTACKADVDGTLYMEFTNDPSQGTADSSLSYEVTANINEVHTLKRTRRYYRTKYTNNGTAQTSFEITTMYENGAILTAPKNLILGQDADAIATRGTDFEIEVAENRRGGYQIIRKFGRNPDVDSGTVPEDIWNGGGIYTGFPLTDVETVEIFSSSVNDTAAGTGARTLYFSGLDGDGNFQEETVTLNGTTPVTTTSTWFRVNTAQVLTSGGNNQNFNVGTITIRHSTTTANVFVSLPIGRNRSTIACYTIPAGFTGYLKEYNVEINRSASAIIDGDIWTRLSGASPQLYRPFSVSQSDTFTETPYGTIPFPALTDIAMRVISCSANNIIVTAEMHIILSKDNV